MSKVPYLRIATEEAFAPPELLDIYTKILAKDAVDPGFKGLMGFYMSSPSARATHIMRCLTDLDRVRLQHMDEAGIDHQVIALTSPGVQVMDKATAVSFSILANDQLAEAVRRHPTRFTGMIAVAPQDPVAAAKEIERGVIKLGMHSVIITAGVFDRFPKLQMIIGHMGEALPFWAYRLDYMHQATVKSQRYDSMKPIRKKPSDYLKENFIITNSGVAWEKAIKFTQDVVGVDRVMYAMDYPYQYAVEEVAVMDNMQMSDADKLKFFQTNAQRVFKIKF